MITARTATQPDESAVLSRAFLRASDKLGLSQKHQAKILGLSAASLSRLARGERSIDVTISVGSRRSSSTRFKDWCALSSIWTRCGGASNKKRLSARPFRAVEAQHRISTRKLTDSDDEQALLEEILERSKPAPAADLEGLHYLLFTPFRYPPLRHGSRFGLKTERGIWYGSQTLPTCFAEVAYYRLVFLEGTTADLSPLLVELTAFQAVVRTTRGVDLTTEPFRAYRGRIASPSRYESTQRLGREMRDDGVEVVRYPSARDRGGANVAVFSPRAFARREPENLETWLCVATKERVEFSRKDYLRERESLVYERAGLEVKGRLPAPAV